MPRRRRPEVRFNQKLVLHRWLLGLFGVEDYEELAKHLKDEELEGLDENNIHRFHQALCLYLPAEGRPDLPDDLLLEYDQAIVGVTRRLNERRITLGEPPITWKYFQYLALLFTEIYLDRYFRDPEALLRALNAQIAAFNRDLDERDRLAPLDEKADAWPQLNKIGFWMATGSGKTLLMHAHILEYRRFLETHGRGRELNRIILLTPNEGLSAQHLREFEKAGIPAERFDKDARGLFAGQSVEILEVTRLRDEMGEKTVAVDAFEGNNLVLVDEGHRGASSGTEGTWLRYRDALCERGFSFEYSATFGQAVKGNQDLTNRYARGILCDYSYRWFHEDGFGKDYAILNLEEDRDEEWRLTYLTACLLAFFQQLRLFRDDGAAFRPFDLDRPLWVFVGGSVTKTLASRDATDIVDILLFLAGYVANRRESVARIERVLNEGLVTAGGRNMFAGTFAYLNTIDRSPEQLFDETLALLFNAPAGGALHVENLKGATGEIALRLGNHEPFGVINVGDDTKLVKLCDEHGLATAEREFAGSLFHALNDPESPVNLLIGSRKFTEGWSSWRVSTMGLMNIGRGEGAQIIQLFGRGVRLKGVNMSLKRTAAAPPQDLETPEHIDILETLQIFGVRADYMAQFRDFLKDEGLATHESRQEFFLPIRKELGDRPLKTIRLKPEIGGIDTTSRDAFRTLAPPPVLGPPERAPQLVAEFLAKYPVVLNWYPKIRALRSVDDGGEVRGGRNQGFLEPRHLAFLDCDRLHRDLTRFKTERGWANLTIPRTAPAELLSEGSSWYRLFIPENVLETDRFEKVSVWYEVVLALLKKYVERYYRFARRAWEEPHLEYRELTEDDPGFPAHVREEGPQYGYRIIVEESQTELIAQLEALREAIANGRYRDVHLPEVKTVWFGPHLYQPLLFSTSRTVKISPVALNEGERRFVEDLAAYCAANPDWLASRELFLMRNLSRGRGVGFFEAGGFHPDFILWVLEGDHQYITFVDPKGLRNVDLRDPKLRFHETVKDIEKRLADASVTLNSFLVSVAPAADVERHWNMTRAEMAERNILFQRDDAKDYIGMMLERTTGAGG